MMSYSSYREQVKGGSKMRRYSIYCLAENAVKYQGYSPVNHPGIRDRSSTWHIFP